MLMSRTRVWAAFIERIAARVRDARLADDPPRLLRQRHLLAWRHGDDLNHVRLLSWLRPHSGRPRAAWITRVSLNHLAFEPSAAVLRSLGFPRATAPRATSGVRVEWTALDEEVVALTGWLPTWIRGRVDPTVAIPLPPHPSHVFGEGLRTTVYVWTAAAWEASARFHRRDARWLPSYAIPAAEITPAAANPHGGHDDGQP